MSKLGKWIFDRAYIKFQTKGQYIFFRCKGCHKVLVHRDYIKTGQCPKCGGRMLSPTNLSFLENAYFFIRIFL